MAECEHMNFDTQARVDRVVDHKTGKVGAFAAEFSIRCLGCGKSFWFPGLGTGVNWHQPVTSADGYTLRAPIVPEGERPNVPESFVGVSVRATDNLKGLPRVRNS